MKVLLRKLVLCTMMVAAALCAQAQALYVGSYNIRYQNQGDADAGNGWQQRLPVICGQILFEHPDIFGTQEVLESQRQDLLRQLPDYDCIGLGRDDGQHGGEHANIFFDKNKVKLLDHGDFWLSENPDRPGLGWDAACVRICTWGSFELKNSCLKFFFFNLHMDHVGTIARSEGAKLVVQRIREIAKGQPVVLTGDFNVDQTNEIYSIFTESGLLVDSYEKAQMRFAENGTFNSWDPELKTASRIDHVFVSPSFAVERYGVLTNAYWSEKPQTAEPIKGTDAPQEITFQKYQKRLPSDHYPVLVRLQAPCCKKTQPLLATHVETGDVEGVLDEGLAVYKAIPYAAPPVGNLRWRAPQPAKAWQGVRKCDTFGPMPPQPTRPGRTADMMSEDCLYLGIATPAKSKCEKLPVMVWIHGGGFQTEWYGGDLWKRLAQRGVVIVSIEYRTGALGFMAHPELTKESKEGHSGNYGLLDQIYALQWVQRNIAQFGGDPSKVTIFGESAGAISCSMLCASPLAKGLFRACISQSGGSFAPWSDQPRSLGLDASQKGAESQGVAFMKHLKKKNLKQLRQMDAMALCVGNVGFSGFWPCVDGYVSCDDQYRLYERGEYNDVPVIVRTNSDEGALFTPGNLKAEDYQKTVKGIFGSWADEALKVYPGNTDDEAWHGFSDCFRDMGFAWPSFAWANLQSQTGKSPAYAAYLAQPSKMSFSQDPRRRGVAHADDIMYLNGHFLDQPQQYPAESATAEIIQQYWVNFAKTCNPNGKGLPYWPSFKADEPTTMQFSNGASLIMRPNSEQIDFVERYYKAKREETESSRR